MLSLASTNLYSTNSTTSASFNSAVLVIYFLIIVIVLVSQWKIYTKAGEPGWKGIIPFYSTWVGLRLTGRPKLWMLWLFIPIVNIYFAIAYVNGFSKSFGKGVGNTFLLLLLPYIGYPMLAFGDAKYVGPGGASGVPPTPAQPTPAVPTIPVNDQPPEQPPAAPTV